MHTLPVSFLPPCKEDDVTTVYSKLPALIATSVEPVGRWFEAFCTRKRHKHSTSHHSFQSSSSEESEAESSDEEEEEDDTYLNGLDPKEWKSQDHYAVLGLKNIRYKASDEKVKRAYKKKVLKHHPDKRKARGEVVKEGDDDYFTCITRAYETLGNPTKRRAYDSVDPEFDDSIPGNDPESREQFFGIFTPAFERNSRWSSSKKPVPGLGAEDDDYESVNNFYSFWYNFDSWREFSYLDEEEKEKGENREERRWIEKQNKAARQKRKKEEIVRIRQLVDNAYACDPRIARFKEEEKAKKAAQKAAKKEAARQKAEEEERIRREAEEAEQKKREQEEEEARIQAAALKKEKDAQKKALKKERKILRTAIKEFDYFATTEKDRVHFMQESEKLADLLSLLRLQDLNVVLRSGDSDKAKIAFISEVDRLNAELEQEKQAQLEAASKQSGSTGEGSKSKCPWSEAEVQVLIKAVNVFPAGTVQRWETVASFITQHVPESKRSAKEVLAKAKELQKMDPNMKQEVNKKAYDHFAKTHHASSAADKSDISERFMSVAEQQVAETGTNPAPWSTDEQKMLEQALRTYPANTEGRWDKIAEIIPSRSKKDCMKRYKELVELVKSKKAAAAAAAAKKK